MILAVGKKPIRNFSMKVYYLIKFMKIKKYKLFSKLNSNNICAAKVHCQKGFLFNIRE